MILFVTYFDKAFYSRGLEMLKSIKSARPFEIMVLALDQETEVGLKSENISNLSIIPLSDMSKVDLPVATNKPFFFTLTADFCEFCQRARPSHDALLYIDADIKFYQSVDIILDEVAGASVAFTKHRHPTMLAKRYLKYGLYNVGINYFKNDTQGKNAVNLWSQRCRYELYDKGRQRLGFFSDQVLVDDFSSIFTRFKTIENIGVNVAPWNVSKYKISKNTHGEWLVDEKLLVCFHFSNLIYNQSNKWDCSFSGSLFFLRGDLRCLYIDYISSIGSTKIAAFPQNTYSLKSMVLSVLKKCCSLYIDDKELVGETKYL